MSDIIRAQSGSLAAAADTLSQVQTSVRSRRKHDSVIFKHLLVAVVRLGCVTAKWPPLLAFSTIYSRVPGAPVRLNSAKPLKPVVVESCPEMY